MYSIVLRLSSLFPLRLNLPSPIFPGAFATHVVLRLLDGATIGKAARLVVLCRKTYIKGVFVCHVLTHITPNVEKLSIAIFS